MPSDGFTTPSNNKSSISSEFRTPKHQLNNDAEIGYKTPVLADANGKPRKKKSFKTPKHTITAEENKIKARKNAKPIKKKSAFTTPKAARSKPRTGVYGSGIADNIDDENTWEEEEASENYF